MADLPPAIEHWSDLGVPHAMAGREQNLLAMPLQAIATIAIEPGILLAPAMRGAAVDAGARLRLAHGTPTEEMAQQIAVSVLPTAIDLNQGTGPSRGTKLELS